jgi:hypothetical protein
VHGGGLRVLHVQRSMRSDGHVRRRDMQLLHVDGLPLGRGLRGRAVRRLHHRHRLRQRTSVRRRGVRRVLDVRRLQRQERRLLRWPFGARLRGGRLQRLHGEQPVRRRRSLRRGDLRHVRHRLAVRAERAMRRQRLRVLGRRAVRVRAALRRGRLRRELTMPVVFGAYDRPVDAKPGEKVFFIGERALRQGSRVVGSNGVLRRTSR